MRNDKQRAITLRISGKSYSQINAILGVPKSTLSGWLSKIVLSDRIRSAIESRGYRKSIDAILKHNRTQTITAQKRARTHRAEGNLSIGSLSERDTLIIGAALYWAEGYKKPRRVRGREITSHPVSLVNADPELAIIFVRFLVETCQVDRKNIIANIRVYEHDNKEKLRLYWRTKLGFDDDNVRVVQQPTSISSLHKRPFNRLPFGVVQILVNNTELFYRIMGHIEGLQGIK